MPSGKPAYQPEATTPTNYTGGLYASDLFLKYYIPLIEQSAAFKDGGLIDVTFDEANPPFANSSFNNANNPGNTAGVTTPATASGYAQSDTAGESFNTRHGVVNVASEPTGPNTPLLKDSHGNQVYPGPGDSAFIDRPASLSGDPVNDPKYIRGRRQPDPGRPHRHHRRQRRQRQQRRHRPEHHRSRRRPPDLRCRDPGERLRRTGDRHRAALRHRQHGRDVEAGDQPGRQGLRRVRSRWSTAPPTPRWR